MSTLKVDALSSKSTDTDLAITADGSGLVDIETGFKVSGTAGVPTADIRADAITGAKIADDAIDSEHYAAGSIDTAHLGDLQVTTAKIAADAITSAKIADDAIDSEHYTDGSIDNAHIADNAIDSEHYADGSIDSAHLADDAVTLAKMAGGTDGNLISYDTSGNPVAVATGSDGQVLTSAGAGAVCLFEDAAGGGSWTMIGTSVASDSASLTITGLDSTYDTYAIAISDIVPVANSSATYLRVGDSSGIDSGSTNYAYHMAASHEGNGSYGTAQYENQDSTNIRVCNTTGNVAGEGIGAMLFLHRPGDGTSQPIISGIVISITGAGTIQGGQLIARRTAVITLDRIQLYMSGGNVDTGRMTVWGISHA